MRRWKVPPSPLSIILGREGSARRGLRKPREGIYQGGKAGDEHPFISNKKWCEWKRQKVNQDRAKGMESRVKSQVMQLYLILLSL